MGLGLTSGRRRAEVRASGAHEADVAKLAVPDIDETLGYVMGAVREIRAR
jgi:uroporphyrinogen decarboxylase